MSSQFKGLHELYQKFGNEVFGGESLRAVMIRAVGAGKGRAGWQASIQLGLLVKRGYVVVVSKDPEAKAAWGHRYKLTSDGLWHAGAPVHGRNQPVALDDDYDEEADIVKWEKTVTGSMSIAERMERGARRVGVSPAFINDADNREVLRFMVAARYVKMTLALTPEGVEWLDRMVAENEGKTENG
jgi:hypothetical protein